MSIIDSSTKFIGINPDFPTAERKSAQVNAAQQVVTMEDIIDTVGNDSVVFEKLINKENSTISTSTEKYPTVNLLKTGLDAKQATLVSGSNIKTVGGTSILGSGDIPISLGLTVGSTAITSGTVGRLLFQGTGNVVQQDAAIFWDNTNKRFGIGATPDSSTLLDLRTQGALSTDIALRVRNSANTADLFSIRGNGEMYFPASANSNQTGAFISGTTTPILKYSGVNQETVSFGFGNSFTNGTLYNTVVGSSCISGASAQFASILGWNSIVNSSSGIAIGNRAKTSGTNAIVIGTTGGNTYYSGTRSIHLGAKGNSGNELLADDVFMTYFNSDSSSTLTRANGSFGLLGQGAYILANGTGTNGLTTFMGNGGNTLVVRSHASVPSTNIVDSFQQYSRDIVAGNAAPHFRTENGDIIKLYKQTLPAVPVLTDVIAILTNLGLI